MNDFIGYLFVYFTGDSDAGEQVYFSISKDGLHWKDLNEGNPVLISSGGEKGVRDPFIIRSANGSKYYIIATDLRIESGKGWSAAQYKGSRAIVIWESVDLVHWSKERIVEVGIPEAGCVWAPEAIYDSQSEDYLVFWASMVKEEGEISAKQRIYCSKTKDFLTFSKAEKYIERDNHVIDTTITWENGYYYRISKDETTQNIKIDKGNDLLHGSFVPVSAPKLEQLIGVEGPVAFQFNGSTDWCLMVDHFATNAGYLPLISNNLSSGEFQVLDSIDYDMGKNKKRHGSVLKITQLEYDTLIDNYNSHNPILKGLYADPDIVQFDDTYYIYPTTDGFSHWSGTQFHVFSSKDKKQWKDEGIILDVATEDVAWAIGSAWAPAIARKDGKYYFYFCAKRTDNVSCIGVAVANHPTGPFIASKEPLITPEMMKSEKISMSQTIDPSIFIEDDGTAYLLFGNGDCAIVPLNEDMVSYQSGTMRQIEGAFDFREAIMILKREGIYHFTWSCDDTGSENYHINYGVSNCVYGPIEFKFTIVEKDLEKDALGTGHHSIMKIENKEEYYIAYHRFGTPLKNYSFEKGCHREVCLDQLEFMSDGLIKPIKVTK
ncbi:MAG: family 43 glycosylhydrolase [Mobilitalea sp.]